MSRLLSEIQDLGDYMRDPRMDGFSQFTAKQRIYEVLWECEKQLKDSPTFSIEEEWINENRKSN
jgi:hypothetical protein